MRVMVMVKATKQSEAGLLAGDPKGRAGFETLLEEMGKFNAERPIIEAEEFGQEFARAKAKPCARSNSGVHNHAD